MNLNLSGTINVFKLLLKPSLCLPHATVSTFNEIPGPVDKAFVNQGKHVDIRAVVLDKDDCFAYPDTNEVYPAYVVCKWCRSMYCDSSDLAIATPETFTY